jgi:hypothetical protein
MAKALRHARSAPAAKANKKHAVKKTSSGSHARPKHSQPKHHASEKTPNLLITIDERHRSRAGDEILTLLERAGFTNAEITNPPGTGMIGVSVAIRDARACIPRLKEILMQTPFAFQHTHRWLPVESWAAPDAAELEKFAKLAGQEIGAASSWGIVVERHNSELDRGLIVSTIAKGIDNPNVSLDAPEKTVLVEVVGKKAALAVVGKDEQLSVDKSMREDFVRFEEVVPFEQDG